VAEAHDLRESELGLETVREEDGREDEGDDRIEDVEREPHEEAEEDRRAARLGEGGEDQLQRDIERDQQQAQTEEGEGEAPRRPLPEAAGRTAMPARVTSVTGTGTAGKVPRDLPRKVPAAPGGRGGEKSNVAWPR